MHEGKALKNAAKTSQIGVTGLADALKIPRSSIYYQLKSENLEEDFKTDALNVLGLKYEQVFGQRGPAPQNEAVPHEETGRIEYGNNGLEFVYMTNGQILMGVPHVTPYVYGGYLSGWGDPTFIEEMPKHYIPVNQKHRGRYVAFTMRGESMYDGTERSISPDDILTGREIKKQYWTSKFHTHDYPEFIIHHKEDGLVVKEIIEHNTEEGWIIAHSYNPEYKDYKILLDDCVEIFNVIEVHKKRGRAKRAY